MASAATGHFAFLDPRTATVARRLHAQARATGF